MKGKIKVNNKKHNIDITQSSGRGTYGNKTPLGERIFETSR